MISLEEQMDEDFGYLLEYYKNLNEVQVNYRRNITRNLLIFWLFYFIIKIISGFLFIFAHSLDAYFVKTGIFHFFFWFPAFNINTSDRLFNFASRFLVFIIFYLIKILFWVQILQPLKLWTMDNERDYGLYFGSRFIITYDNLFSVIVIILLFLSNSFCFF
jgi:hypothetical protein